MTSYPSIIFALFVLGGCRTLDQAPITTLFVIDTDHQICSVRKITDKRTLESEWVIDVPLSDCDGVVGLDSREFLDLRTFLKRGAKDALSDTTDKPAETTHRRSNAI